jgi:hypothetical protein
MTDTIDRFRQELRQWRPVQLRLLQLRHVYDQLGAGLAELEQRLTQPPGDTATGTSVTGEAPHLLRG